MVILVSQKNAQNLNVLGVFLFLVVNFHDAIS